MGHQIAKLTTIQSQLKINSMHNIVIQMYLHPSELQLCLQGRNNSINRRHFIIFLCSMNSSKRGFCSKLCSQCCPLLFIDCFYFKVLSNILLALSCMEIMVIKKWRKKSNEVITSVTTSTTLLSRRTSAAFSFSPTLFITMQLKQHIWSIIQSKTVV